MIPKKLILNDLHLKCCILKENDKNKISGSYPHLGYPNASGKNVPDLTVQEKSNPAIHKLLQ